MEAQFLESGGQSECKRSEEGTLSGPKIAEVLCHSSENSTSGVAQAFHEDSVADRYTGLFIDSDAVADANHPSPTWSARARASAHYISVTSTQASQHLGQHFAMYGLGHALKKCSTTLLTIPSLNGRGGPRSLNSSHSKCPTSSGRL